MSNTDKELSSLIRSMKRVLKDQHGVDVPYSALRASYLQARGENPHAFAGRKADTQHAAPAQATFAGAAGPTAVCQTATPETPLTRTLYLASDEFGQLTRFSLFQDGSVVLPEDFKFSNASVERQFVHVPRQSCSSLPDFVMDAKAFYALYQLDVCKHHQFWAYPADDGVTTSCKVVMSMPDADWETVLQAALDENPEFRDEVGEWVGMHYERLLDQEPKQKQLEWVQRYLDVMAEAERLAPEDDYEEPQVDVLFTWDFFDGVLGSVEASVYLDCQVVAFKDDLPQQVQERLKAMPHSTDPSKCWQTRIHVPANGASIENALEGDSFEAYVEGNIAGGWTLKTTRDACAAIRAEYGLTA